MARIEQVIHVKGTDGVVQECALFDASSDIPSGNPNGIYAKELALNGSKIYAAMITEELFRLDESDDLKWMYDNLSTPLHLFWDGDAHRLLTTPYFIRPLVDGITVGADGGQFYLTDIVSSNGSIESYGFSDSFLSRTLDGSGFAVAANTTTSARTFTVTLGFRFADGSVQGVQLTGTQDAGAERVARTITFIVSPASRLALPTLTVNGESVPLDIFGGGEVTAYDGDVLEWTCSLEGYVTQSGTHTVNGDATITIELMVGIDPDPGTGGGSDPDPDPGTGTTTFTVYNGSGVGVTLTAYLDGKVLAVTTLSVEETTTWTLDTDTTDGLTFTATDIFGQTYNLQIDPLLLTIRILSY